ncbi:hypothetical protein WMY93_016744 [Mugilogobius chulae]|uniref:Ig-like domain-containing protein n=1 Tax=Mugilogobius chulae TaxID=88201 RepID=A0AAW0NWG5_9GOBI
MNPNDIKTQTFHPGNPSKSHTQQLCTKSFQFYKLQSPIPLFPLEEMVGVDGADVTQTEMIWKREGEDATMDCSHTKGLSYFQMYFYRQRPGENMRQIVFTTTSSSDFEPDFKDKNFKGTSMFRQGITFLLILYGLQATGQVEGADVTQTETVWAKEGDEATLSCSHTKGAGYTQMYWYRQLPGETMRRVVYTMYGIKEHDFGEFSKDKYSAERLKAETGTFTVKSVTAADKAMYFCADTNTFRLITFLLILYKLHIKGQVEGADVTQTEMVWTKEGDDATMSCSHTKDAGHNQMYWYRQPHGETMRLVVYTLFGRKEHDFGDFSKDKYSAERPNVQTGTFTVKGVTAADEAMYFCAVSVCFSSVIQKDILWESEGGKATFTCSHTKGASYYQMYWYRQRPGENMRQIVFTTTTATPDFEADFKNDKKFKATKEKAESGTLTVENLEPGDSGVYFCSVSEHSETSLFQTWTKTQLIFGCTLDFVANFLAFQDAVLVFNIDQVHCDTGANEAYFGGGTKLTVLEKDRKPEKPNVKVFPPSENERPRRVKTLVCLASEFYPDHVTVSWQVNGDDRTKIVSTDAQAQRDDDYYRISSRLRVDLSEWTNPENKFQCIVKFYDGETYVSVTDQINGIEEDYLKVTQQAKLSYVVFIAKGVVYGLFVAFLQTSAEPLSLLHLCVVCPSLTPLGDGALITAGVALRTINSTEEQRQ